MNINRLINLERLTHATKTALACLIGFSLTRFIGFPSDQWVIITIIVVMCAQIYVGSIVQKAYLRFLGTLLGCLFATIAIVAFGNSGWVIASTIAISAFIFSFIAPGQEGLNYAGTLGAATTAIIMLSGNPTLVIAGERFLEISVGLLIATLISQFVLPIHARTHLRKTQADTLTQLRDYYIACMVTRKVDAETYYYEELDENIIQSLSKQRQLAKESAREPLGVFFDPAIFVESLRCEREILRAIDFMHNAIIHIKNIDLLFSHSTALQNFNNTIVQSLNSIIKAIESEDASNQHVDIPPIWPLLSDLKKTVQLSSEEDWRYIDGFLFTAETLVGYLKKLAMLTNIRVVETAG